MRLDNWTTRLARHRRFLSFAGLLAALTGMMMVLNPSHVAGMEWVGLLLLVFGIIVFEESARTRAARTLERYSSLGARFLKVLTLHGQLTQFFPYVGVGLLVADLVYNFRFAASPAFLTEDIIMFLTAAALIGYRIVPGHYARERDFVLLFFFFLDVVLVAPLIFVRAIAGNADASVDIYSRIALAPELGAILTLLGVSNSVHDVPGATAPGLTFTPVQMSTPVTLVITTACSGIYSFGIFACAYVAFLLVEYGRPSFRLWLLLTLGFLASYLANLLRMVIIVLVGYYTDSAETQLQNLLIAHSYAGWLIFLAWLGLFWMVLYRFLPIESGESRSTFRPAMTPWRKRSMTCRKCGDALSPVIPAVRCVCGAIYHASCLAGGIACVFCHRIVPSPVAPAGETRLSAP